MSTTRSYFGVEPVRYHGPEGGSSLGYRYYDKDRVVRGKRMEDQLRLAGCYWHSFCGDGSDVFGAGTFNRAWQQNHNPLEGSLEKASAAFEFFQTIGVRYFCFHDRDVAPETSTLQETNDLLDRVADAIGTHMESTGVRLLWGTANLFGHPRYMSGAATNPDPEVFAHAAAQVKKALEITKRLGGENYVLWGGREGYETLLNTDLKRELDQLGRFMAMVAEHKHKIGFKGPLLIEPKPMEPTKHQYDFDSATVYAFLQRYGLGTDDFKLNIEANHATLAGHSFEHEIAYAIANDLLGSVDINRGDTLLGWDTDQFPSDQMELALVLRRILAAGGFKTGGFNFDAKVRRQSIDPVDLVHAHVGGIDVLARALLAAERMLEDGALQAVVDERYAGWEGPLGKEILSGRTSLAQLSERVVAQRIDPKPRSGRQEALENLVSRYLK
jgi:xylose isomerase